MPYDPSAAETLRDPTIQDWAAAVSGYIAEAYGMSVFETGELISSIGAVLRSEGFNPNAGVSLPLRVREQVATGAELTRAMSAESLGRNRSDHTPELRVDPGVWADFICRYLEYSEAIDAPRGLVLWRRLCEALATFDLESRPIVWLSVPLQQALPLDDVRPVFDVAAVV